MNPDAHDNNKNSSTMRTVKQEVKINYRSDIYIGRQEHDRRMHFTITRTERL